MNATIIQQLEAACAFTETYRQYQNDPISIREAMCLRAQYRTILTPIEESDQFAGRLEYGVVGFRTHSRPDSFAYYCDFSRFEQLIKEADLNEQQKAVYAEVLNFWRTEDSAHRTRAAYSPELARAFPSDRCTIDSGAVFPLYRMAGVILDFDRLLQIGLPGLRKEVQNAREQAVKSGGDVQLFQGMLLSITLLSDILIFYADQARRIAADESVSVPRRKELENLADILLRISEAKPETFQEAIQLVWLYATVATVEDYGRMDVYLGDFLVRDLNSAALSEEQALSLLQSLWRLMAARKTTVNGRVIIGGKGRRNERNADRFAVLALEATRSVREIEPQLTMRWYEGMDPELFDIALDVLGEGRTFPILYNDDVNVEAVMKAFDVSEEEAEQYVPYGCGEYVLQHRSVGTPSGLINLLKILEITLYNGIDPLTDQRIGIETGEIRNFSTFEELLDAYKGQVRYFVEHLADQEELEYRIAGEISPFHYLSMLHDDCLRRGKAIFSGGVRYLGGTLETYGNTSTADSLLVIKSLVFDNNKMTLEEMRRMLERNYVGYEDMYRSILQIDKYGNNDEPADAMLLEIHNHICHTTRMQRERTGLHSYLVVNINNAMNTGLGKQVMASADGRKAGQPMTNGNTPGGGNDRKGLTALLNSLVKPNPGIHAGMVQNMKFSRELFLRDRLKLKGLLKTYFAKGGTQTMITVVNRDELQQAMVEPEKYRELFVRVGGFSARFVELPREVQLDIVSRTVY